MSALVGVSGALPKDGVVAFVQRGCPTCSMVAEVVSDLHRRAGMTVVSQDDPAFPAGSEPLDDSQLELSYFNRIETVPTVRSATYDRAFPHTLRIRVVPEVPVAVLHRGKETWLVSARGRVLFRIPNLTLGALARIWVPRATAVDAGAFLPPAAGGIAARTLALALRFPARIATASLAHGLLVFRLRSGLALELGEPTDVRLKLAVARRALAALPPGAVYVDVSVPGRPVAGTNSKLSAGG